MLLLRHILTDNYDKEEKVNETYQAFDEKGFENYIYIFLVMLKY